ncbi:MAG TPA: hypothetical protein VF469_29880 [Kofleriaceae bacterium]
MTFDSYYWRKFRLTTPDLQRARELVTSRRDLQAFELLLHSEDTAAVGIAFDQYHYADASTRYGTSSPFAKYDDEVVARAREILRRAPSPESDAAEPGASHASALGALANLAEPEDAELIVRALSLTRTPNLRLAAAMAAGSALEKAASPNEQLIMALGAIVLDDTATHDERSGAIAALGRTRSELATDALLRTTLVRDPSLQASAALHLLDRDRRAHRARVEELARSWPNDPPYPAEDVLELLAEPGESDGEMDEPDEG